MIKLHVKSMYAKGYQPYILHTLAIPFKHVCDFSMLEHLKVWSSLPLVLECRDGARPQKKRGGRRLATCHHFGQCRCWTYRRL